MTILTLNLAQVNFNLLVFLDPGNINISGWSIRTVVLALVASIAGARVFFGQATWGLLGQASLAGVT